MRKGTAQLSLVLEVNPKTQACYLRVSKRKVAHTEVIREWPLLAVDRSADGRVVGVESVGGKGVSVMELIRAAGLRVTAATLGKLDLNLAPAEKREMACA